MTYLQKSIIYILVPPIVVIGFSIWIGAALKTDGLSLSNDERAIAGMEHKTNPPETKEVSPEIKKLKNIFSIKKQLEIPALSDVLPQPEKEEAKKVEEKKETKPIIEKISHNLSLILILENKKIAIIDGKTLKEGDSLADNSIVKVIEADRVMLINGHNEEWLSIR